MSSVQVQPISSTAGGPALAPDQKRFNTLIRQIEQAREKLKAWHDQVPLFAQARARLLVPLREQFIASRREWVFALDALLAQPGWTRPERDVLRELVCDGAAELLEAAEDEDPALKALFDAHSEVDFDAEQQRMRSEMKQMVEAMTELDLGDDEDIASEADLFQRMKAAEAEAAEQAESRAAEKQARQASQRKQTAAQQRREADAQLATQSVREIFRKLASALHPDREPDLEQRVEKTALMQKANQAYAANDLLTLLELQLQIEQVDALQIAGISPQRLKQYNKVLAEQLAELKADAERAELHFRMDFGLEPGWGLNPMKLFGLIDEHAKLLRADLAAQQRDVLMLGNKEAVKRWLKREKRRRREAEFDGGLF